MGAAGARILRIEAGLAAANGDLVLGVDAHGWAWLRGEPQQGGLCRQAGNDARDPRRVLRGLMFDCDVAIARTGLLWERQVVTSVTRSPMFECTIVTARLSVEHAQTERPSRSAR